MEQTKALNALEPFLALSKTATSPRAASDLVTQATSAPNTFVFAELLQTPNIQKLRGSQEYASHLTLLEVFAWGTWEEYKEQSSEAFRQAAPEVVAIILTTTGPVSFHAHLPHLMSARPPHPAPRTTRHDSHLCGPHNRHPRPCPPVVAVTSVAPLRDLAPGSLPILQQTLSTWSQRCDSALQDLELRAAEVKKAAVDREKLRRKKERAMEVMMQLNEEKGGKGARTGGLEEDLMDIDQEGEVGGLQGAEEGRVGSEDSLVWGRGSVEGLTQMQ
ncbi:hypothetical protein N0V90_009319 [Kalmusia sp. IMI 367209]|nr:hypothetical protein N0V90_009319 [Kalmusia sp. IMI 367209]